LAFYVELKSWQGAIGSVLGFVALFLGALWNARLNRLRDDRLRQAEVAAVAAAIYGELILVRVALARLARVHARVDLDRESSVDQDLVDDLRLPDPALYRALASKIGMLPADVVVAVVTFHANAHDAQAFSAKMIPDDKRGYTYGACHVVQPAMDGVRGIEAALRRLEVIAGLPAADTNVDTGDAELVLEIEEDQRAHARAEAMAKFST
jgi:hypothetical protein